MISKGLHIGPSPNWYLINVSDSNSEHVFAYGAKTNICLIEARSLPPTYCGLFVAHSDRVSILKFCRSPKHPNLLVSAAEDGRVKLWDITAFKCLNEISSSQKITCIEWQGSREDTVFLSYEPGQLLKWKIDTEAAIPIKTVAKSSITALSCCPRNPNILAIGYRGGLIAILDVELGTLNQKLKGHDNDILSLSWAPLLGGQTQGSLLSSSRDKSLRVWDVEQERAHHVLYAPSQQLAFLRRDELNKMRFFVAGTWLSSHHLLVGFPSGDISTLDLEDTSQHWVTLDSFEVGGHSRCIFNISVTPDGKKAFSISLDRQIVIWDLENKKAIFSLATLGGFAYSLGFSPLERGRLAIGGGDNSLRVWNLTSSTKGCSTYWQGIKGKVITLAWHPSKEGIVAFGTDEGRVAYLDTNTNKPPVCSSTYHRNTVYCIRWGPYLLNDNGIPLEESSSGSSAPLDLYSCGDGHIYIHSAANLQREARNFDHLVKKYVDHQNRPLQRTELAWKQDFTAIAVGNEDGSIEIYSTWMVLLARLEGPKKLIQCLSWHPRYTGTSDLLSPLHGWLACASNENTIYVYDLARVISEGAAPLVVTEATRELVGHHFRVVALAWSPHCDGHLASASYDATVQVWDVVSTEPLANYQGHKGRLFCVEWSPLDSDVVFSGGEDSTVQQWHISQCASKLPPLKEKNKSKKSSSPGLTELEMLLEQKKRDLMAQHQFGPGGDHPAEMMVDQSSLVVVANGGGDCGALGKCAEEETTSESRKNSISDDLSCLPPAKETKITFAKSAKQSKFKKTDSANESKKLKKKAQKSYFPLTSNMDCSGKHRGQEDCIFLLNYFYPPKLETRSNKGSKKSSRKVSFSDGKSLLEAKSGPSNDLQVSSLFYSERDSVEDESFLLANESILSASSHESQSDAKITLHPPSTSEEDQESKTSNPSEEVSSTSEDKQEGWKPSSYEPEDFYYEGEKAPKESCELSYYSSSTTSLNTTHSDGVEPSISALVDEMLTYVTQECPDATPAFPNEVEQTLPIPKRRPRLIRKSIAPTVKSTAPPNCVPQPNLGFFLNNMSTRKVLSMEATHHRDNANFDYYSQMEVWQGNIGNVLREAADQKKLNDLLVSLAPLGSTKLWREMCECYAQQLVGEGQYHKAVLYLLACHHVHKAVQVFKNNGLFREAIALARARLSATDHVIHDLYLTWGNHADKEGNYELAAKCYLSINLPVAASKVLAKRNDPSSVRVAGLIARRCGQADKAAMYAHAALREALLRGEWDVAREVCGDHPNMEGFLLLIELHREVMAKYEILRMAEDISGEGQEALLSTTYWKELRLEDGQLLTEGAVHHWQEDGGSTVHLSPKLIKSLPFKSPHLRNMKEALLKVSLELFQEIILIAQ